MSASSPGLPINLTVLNQPGAAMRLQFNNPSAGAKILQLCDDTGTEVFAFTREGLLTVLGATALEIRSLSLGSPAAASATAVHAADTGGTAAASVSTGLTNPDVARNVTAKASAAGTSQVETATAAGTITTAGNATVIVTAAGMTGSPKTISVAVALNDTASQVAGKIRTALAADTAVSALFTVSGSTTAIILTAKSSQANDATLNVDIADGTCVGITAAHTSADTTAGVAGVTGTVTVHGSLGGVTQTEDIVLSSSSAVAGLKMFDAVASYDRPAGGGTVSIGTGNKVGLGATFSINRFIRIFHAGAAELDANGAADALDAFTLDGTNVNLNCLDTAQLAASADGTAIVCDYYA